MLERLFLLFATQAEATHTIASLECKPTSHPDLYTWDKGHLAISGIGCMAAAACITRHAPIINRIVNLGAAGALRPGLPLKSVQRIASVARNPLMPEGIDIYSAAFHTNLFPQICIEKSGLRLLSSDYPIHHPTLQHKLAAHADLVDMEGYGAAFAAQKLNVPIEIVKVVSDFADARGPALIQEVLDEVSLILSEEAEKMKHKDTKIVGDLKQPMS